MKSLAPIASTVLQSVYIFGLIELVTTVLRYDHIKALYGDGDPRLMAGFISNTIVELLIAVVIGLVGVVLAWYSLQRFDQRPTWFLAITRFFGWAWIVFIPIGTVAGFFMLRWRKPLADPQAITLLALRLPLLATRRFRGNTSSKVL